MPAIIERTEVGTDSWRRKDWGEGARHFTLPRAGKRPTRKSRAASGAMPSRAPSLQSFRGTCERLLRVAAATLLLLSLVQPAFAASTRKDAGYDRLVDAVVARYHLPGLAVGVIDHGEVVYTRTVGELAIGSGKRIDADIAKIWGGNLLRVWREVERDAGHH